MKEIFGKYEERCNLQIIPKPKNSVKLKSPEAKSAIIGMMHGF